MANESKHSWFCRPPSFEIGGTGRGRNALCPLFRLPVVNELTDGHSQVLIIVRVAH